MSKQEITKKIEELELDKFCEECKDRGLDWNYLYKLDEQIKELKALLNE